MTGKKEEPKRETRYLIKGDNTYAINVYHTPEEILAIYNGELPIFGPKIDS